MHLRIVCLLMALVGHSLTAAADSIAGSSSIPMTSKKVDIARFDATLTRVDRLVWRGGIEIASSDRRFGGFSGLEIAKDGKSIIAVSDQGWWFSAKLKYRRGRLDSAENASMAPLLYKSGKRSGKKDRRDAEALAAFDGRGLNGPLLVGYERKQRVELFDLPRAGFNAKPLQIEFPKAIAKGPRNGELESLLRVWKGPFDGWYLAISEKNYDSAGNIRGWRWNDSETIEFTIARHEDFRITDVALLPDAETIVTLERSFSRKSFPGVAVRRFRIKNLKTAAPAKGSILMVARQPVYAIDNMEGLAVHQTEDGETRLTMISDDNYNLSLQRTLLYQFAYRN